MELSADGVNVFLEGQWHSETGLKFVFLNHMWFSVLFVGVDVSPVDSGEFVWKGDLGLSHLH